MSLEKAIEALTAAVEANTAMLKGIGQAAGKGTAATTTTTAKNTKPKGPTQEQIAAKFGAFLNTDDKALRKERIALMGKVNAHFGVAKITDATPEQWTEALEMLAKMEAGEDPFDDDDGAGEALV